MCKGDMGCRYNRRNQTKLKRPHNHKKERLSLSRYRAEGLAAKCWDKHPNILWGRYINLCRDIP